MTTILPASFVRRQLGDILDRAMKRHERFVVTRRGEPVVIILGIEDREAIEKRNGRK